MPEFQLPSKQSVVDALAAGEPVHERLYAAAASAGITLDWAIINPDGSASVHTDQDPTAQWLAWNPFNPTAIEQQDQAVKDAIRDARTELQQIKTVASGSANLTQAQIKTGFFRLADTLDQLIAHLDKTNVI